MLENPLKEKNKKKKKNDDGIKTDSLLRETSSHYIRLIGDADRKARIMIVVNSILLTVGVTLLTRVIGTAAHIWISAVLLIIANLITLFFSILSVKPELHSKFDKETENHMLHYKKCIEYTLAEYKNQLLNMLNDNDKKIDAMIKDLYFYGNLLSMKYRLIKVAYRIFFWGLLIVIISYVTILLINYYTRVEP